MSNFTFPVTQGNHTVTQSLFATPCIPAHDANITINGFDSAFRDAGNGTAITILTVPITPEIENQTIWFFDYNTCGQGGVGGINVNESSFENTDAFIVRYILRSLSLVALNCFCSVTLSDSMVPIRRVHRARPVTRRLHLLPNRLVLRIRMVLSAP